MLRSVRIACACAAALSASRNSNANLILFSPFLLADPYIIPGMEPSRSQRDLIGYGPKPPNPRWPGGARLAVNFVLNYEEGGENSILYGDKASEAFLSEIVGAQPVEGARHMSMESIYEYASPCG